ncbi:hypothetical protein ACIBAH_34105 [Streptomyces sp. NPDC051445]|uniref:hypothetical protein n=1 Tax=Streptomyces sp. NPDC051445 TaxID=3365653 RepID=UPI0037BC53A7
MKAEFAESVPIGLMGRYGMPLDRFYGQPMDAVTWADDRFLHSNPACRAPAKVGPGEAHRVRFGAFFAARMCGCCRVESAVVDVGLVDAVVDLVSLCEGLEDEDEEVENRQESNYVPDFLGPNFNSDHWRCLQFLLTVTTDGLQTHPWLHNWARPVLAQTAVYAERRCEEQRTLIDTATIERAAVTLRQREESTTHLTQAWQAWRQRRDSFCDASPDYACYDKNARLRPPGSAVGGHSATTVEISVRLPPIGPDWDGSPLVETLSTWELAAIAAYKTAADWAGSIVTLAAPPVVAQELLNPARALEVTPRPSGTGRKP